MLCRSSSKQSDVKAQGAPRSLAELGEAAALPPFSTAFTPMSYYRSVESLVSQAETYLDTSRTTDISHSQEEAYTLLLKAATLAIQQLPNHPDFMTKLNPERRKMLEARSKVILEQLSALKPAIKKRRDKWERDRPPETIESDPPLEFHVDADNQQQEPQPHRTVLKRRSAVRPLSSSSSHPTVGTPPPLSRRPSYASDQSTASIPFRPASAAASHEIPHLHDLPPAPDLDLYAQLPSWRPFERELSQPSHHFDSTHQSQQGFVPASGTILYPSIHKQSRIPPRPPKDALQESIPQPSPAVTPPASSGLRALWLPNSLIDSFVALAWHNTEQKTETCGLLLGQFEAPTNELRVKALLIPRQKGNPDSCEMIDEETIFEAQEKHDLLTLGWIHTHPVQTCFLSSVDLHTHCAYQISLAEAIAVVCAPNKDPSVGIFRLTDPPGLGLIMECTEKGFHPHKPAALYTDADTSAGHVRLCSDTFELIDLRLPEER